MTTAYISLFLLITVSGQPERAIITDCSTYSCDEGVTYDVNDETVNVMCPSSEETSKWLSKTFGIVWEDDFMLGICRDYGYDTVSMVYQAAPLGASKNYPNYKSTTCNVRYSVDITPEWMGDMETSLQQATWQCVEYPIPFDPVNCCDRTKWKSDCVDVRGWSNNFDRCAVPKTGPDSCANICNTDKNADECYDCCIDIKQEAWNCPAPETPKAEVFSCEEYECDTEHRYKYTKYGDSYVKCPENDGKDWFSKAEGTLEEGSPMGFCQANGYAGLNMWVYNAWPGGPSDPTDKGSNEKDWKCNRKRSRGSTYDYVSPGGEDSEKRLTWKCEKGSDAAVDCCVEDTWKSACFYDRIAENNYQTCETLGTCDDRCGGPNAGKTSCFECCAAAKGDKGWNCNKSAAPTRTPTASPVDEGPPPSNTPTRSPTVSPVDPSDSTASPTVFDKVTAELLCRAAKNKKDCKKALTKDQGKCKFKSGKKSKAGCKLKSFNAPVDCLSLTKRQCKTAIKKHKCVAADAKGHTCKYKEN